MYVFRFCKIFTFVHHLRNFDPDHSINNDCLQIRRFNLDKIVGYILASQGSMRAEIYLCSPLITTAQQVHVIHELVLSRTNEHYIHPNYYKTSVAKHSDSSLVISRKQCT